MKKVETSKGVKPQYVIFLGNDWVDAPVSYNGGYYKGSVQYGSVKRDEAERLTHKDADLIKNKLRRIGYKQAVIELV